MSAIDINTLLSEASCYACYGPVPVPELAELALLARISQQTATPTGPIDFLGLGTFGSNTVATSYSTTVPNAIPAKNSLVLAVVMSGRDALVAGTPTLTGAGLTWVLVQSISVGAGIPTISVFRALGTATAGFVSADFAGVSQDGCIVSVHQFTQVNTSGTSGSGAIVQSLTAGPTGSGVSISATMAAFNANGNNAGFFAIGKGSNPPGITPKAAWTQALTTGFSSIAHGQGYGIADQYRLATTDNVPSATYGFTGGVTGIAIEIKSILS